jgi:alpha-L-rhamnosidase
MAWDAQQVGSDGLFTINSADGADWNVETTSGQLTYVNAVYVEALQAAGKLARALGRTAQASQYLKAAGAVARSVNAHLWDRGAGVYEASTTQRGAVVQDANVTAILAGIPSHSRARAIIAVLRRRLRHRFGLLDVSSPVPSGYTQDISPYMGSFNVLADFSVGDEAAALALIRQEWGYMVGHDPGGVDWERIQLDGVPKGGPLADSLAHAWSTGPTPALSEYVLGVRPASPGFLRWTVTPQPGPLRWAQGVVPTPRGQISAGWRRSGQRSFVMTVQVPAHTSATVEIPLLGQRRAIARDGKLVRPNVVRGGYAVFRGVSGTHTWAWAAG